MKTNMFPAKQRMDHITLHASSIKLLSESPSWPLLPLLPRALSPAFIASNTNDRCLSYLKHGDSMFAFGVKISTRKFECCFSRRNLSCVGRGGEGTSSQCIRVVVCETQGVAAAAAAAAARRCKSEISQKIKTQQTADQEANQIANGSDISIGDPPQPQEAKGPEDRRGSRRSAAADSIRANGEQCRGQLTMLQFSAGCRPVFLKRRPWARCTLHLQLSRYIVTL
jgi:hypothetical protein